MESFQTTEFKKSLSVVVPVFKAAGCLPVLHGRLVKTLAQIVPDYEIIFVNDGGPEEDWREIRKIAETDKKVIAVNLSRNFGQHNAISAGLDLSSGEWVVVMDCDLQDQPEEIINLFNKAREGYDVVVARRNNRQDTFVKKTVSRLFYFFLSYLTETHLDPLVANFGIFHRKVILAICSMKDSIRFFPAMVRWVGFKSAEIDVSHAERKYGKTSYSFRKLLRLGLDVMLAFSEKPLKLVVKAGLLISVISFLFIIFLLVIYVRGGISILGWSSLIVSVWFLSGIMIFVLGVIGLYVGKIFEKVKGRPNYIISERIN